MSGPAWWLFLALTLAAGEPELGLRDSWLVLDGVPAILDGEEVRRQLDSGLTTSFVFRVEAVDPRGRRVEGLAQVEVRFEPWDAVYFVATLSAHSGREPRQLESFDALRSWWRRPALAVLDTTGLDRAGPWQVVVEVRVIPFSASEQEDARRWFARSLETPAGAAEEVGKATDEQTRSLGRVMQLLMATSIQRRVLERHRWTVVFDP